MASADSVKQGLAESQDVARTPFESYEDPALSWIDLVASFRSGDPRITRACLQIAKQSHWSHDKWEDACQELEEAEDLDYEADAPSAMMTAQRLRNQTQQEIDEFFEE